MCDQANISRISSLKVDYLGFIFYRNSKRFIGESPDVQLFAGIPPNIEKVGVFVDEKPFSVIQWSRQYEINTVQLHGAESPYYCNEIQQSGLKVIKAFGISDEFHFEKLVDYMPVCDYFLFDSKTPVHGGSGTKYNWDLLGKYKFGKPFFISGGIGPEDAKRIKELKYEQLYAVDINSRFEIAPGKKNVSLIGKFINEFQQIIS